MNTINSGRLIIHKKPQNASDNMAIDYSLLLNYKKPILRLYTWSPPAISIGRFQSLREEVNLEYCQNNNIDIVRRITGGGAVFHDQEITYSFFIPEINHYFPNDLSRSYQYICNSIIKALAYLNLKAEFKPINDIVINQKKISGCAQTRKRGVILQHGTLLIGLNTKTMFKCLKISKEKIADKNIVKAEDRVTCLDRLLKSNIDYQIIINFLVKGFSDNFDIHFTASDLNDKEKLTAKMIAMNIFNNNRWLNDR